ncbi:MAG: hypothetical protein M1817_004044 [Caeruleum heppii]|nr:MAG: hypothetical protein M1817_004044 [Caeruleum heppii]
MAGSIAVLAQSAAPGPLTLHEALSGLSGSISLAAWVFLLIPQLLENYKKGSADGISLTFLTVWFIGDLTNFVGAVWAALVPTVIALAVYFCFADLILISQCLYYNFLNARDRQRRISVVSDRSHVDDPERPLLERSGSENLGLPGSRRRSSIARRRYSGPGTDERQDSPLEALQEKEDDGRPWLRNTLSVALILLGGAGGWLLAWSLGVWAPTPEGGEDASPINTALGAQVLGYISAICYLG